MRRRRRRPMRSSGPTTAATAPTRAPARTMCAQSARASRHAATRPADTWREQAKERIQMNTINGKSTLISALAILGLAAASIVGAQERGDFGSRGSHAAPFNHDGRGFVLDNRYNHGHYYPAPGTVFRNLPEGYRAFAWRDGSRF